MRNTPTKKKIAVLGGGISSLTSVFEITNQPDWQDYYDITLYQVGWRLGGKGASGRNREIAHRIEEHGLHLWFGFYDNAFGVMRKCYEENNRPIHKPLSSWKDAFQSASVVVLHEQINGKWKDWPFEFPPNEKLPGEAVDTTPSIWEMIKGMVRAMMELYITTQMGNAFGKVHYDHGLKKFFRDLNTSLVKKFKKYSKIIGFNINDLDFYDSLDFLDEYLDQIKDSKSFRQFLFILKLTRSILWKEMKTKINEFPEVKRIWVLFDLTASNLIGMIKDDVINKGFQVINHLDYREWVSKYSYTPKLTAWSAPVQGLYGLIFCGFNERSFEAGTALRGNLKLALTYKGGFYYRMMAGMGDVVFAPMYEVLKKRGVKFKFFHKVKNLSLSADKKNIEAIQMSRQVNLKSEEYEPLYDVKELPCWPSEPLYDQIVEGEYLKENKINLESHWAKWKDVEEMTLEKGRDFDEVIFGISLGAVPHLCKEILAVNEDWRNMVKHITTTPTQAVQLWMKPGTAGTGWPHLNKDAPLSGAYEQPLDTMADLGNLIPKEDWPANNHPGSIAYLCGPYPENTPGAFEDENYPEDNLRIVKENAIQFLERGSGHLWPALRTGPSFNWNVLVDEQDRQGHERIESQYTRVNVDPSEFYVLSEAGTSKYRIKAGESGFQNLVITGDWTDNGFNAGCIEATVISGLQAARAITGRDILIIGEHDITIEMEKKQKEKQLK